MSAQDQIEALQFACERIPMGIGLRYLPDLILEALSDDGWELARRDGPRLLGEPASPAGSVVGDPAAGVLDDGPSDDGLAEGDPTAGGNHG